MTNSDTDSTPEKTLPASQGSPAPKKAIAIQQDGEKSLPKMIAKGSGKLAEKILDIAFREGVKVRQDKDLTELLDAFDVESPVPLEALHAVSLILERVYAENNKIRDKTELDTGNSDISATSGKETAQTEPLIEPLAMEDKKETDMKGHHP